MASGGTSLLLCHAFSLVGCLCHQERGELVRPAPPVQEKSVEVQGGEPEMCTDAWAEGHGRGLACGLHVCACVHRCCELYLYSRVHRNIQKKQKDSLLWACPARGNPPARLPGCLSRAATVQEVLSPYLGVTSSRSPPPTPALTGSML